jgi:serine/threonine protein kinase/predicted ATPase
MTRLSITTLGTFQATLDDMPLREFESDKARALLVYLVIEASRPHRREALAGLLWPDVSETAARANLRRVLSNVRQVIGDRNSDAPFLLVTRQSIQFDVERDFWLDVAEFQQAVTGEHGRSPAIHQLEQAVALYNGPFLAGFSLPDSAPFEEWLRLTGQALEQQVGATLRRLAHYYESQADYAAGIPYARRWLELDPYAEVAHRQMMRLLALSGQRSDALAQYDTCCQRLADELGIEPAAETQALADRIRSGELKPKTAVSPRQTIRGYELRQLLGQGSYGSVYRAYQPVIGRDVAIKVILPQYANQPDFIRRFDVEAQLVARLEHPHIVPLYDYWREPDGAYLVMRWLRAGSLRDALQRGPWHATTATHLVDQIATALAVAHHQGVVHRDIKPGNILLDEENNAYLSDFGIATLTGPLAISGQQAGLTTAEGLSGTPEYVSPELIQGAEVTPQADIYSLGVVVYELLTGRHPFPDLPQSALLECHLHTPLPSVTEIRPDLPPAIDDIIQTATAKNPNGRYPHALALAQALRQVYNKLGVNSREEAVTQGRRLGLLASTARPPHNLPLPPTPFIGREAALDALASYLADPATRLITILGPGGIGKTRLALAAAWDQVNSRQTPHPFAQGIYFVRLAGLETADLILPTIAQSLNFRFEEGDDPQEQLLRFLGRKAMLLLLDNFEHLADGTGLIEAIRQTAPGVKLLVTSRARLKLQAEQLLPLGGMAVPGEVLDSAAVTFDQLTRYSTIRLFELCARRMQPDFTLTADNQAHVVTICRLVEGMPLGIVLAAAWLGALTPAEIAAEMKRDPDFLAADMADAPERQRSLRAAFNHSWRLLSQQEQAIFARLSVFRNGFSREAAQTVTGATLRGLQALVNKSLLHRAPDGRYEVHELLRQFATEQMSEAAAKDARDRHSAYFCAFLHERTEDWHTGRQIETIRVVAQEGDNVRQAWQWALTQGEWPRLLQAIDSWYWYLRLHGRLRDFDFQCLAIIRNMESMVAEETNLSPDRLRLWVRALTWLVGSEDDPCDSSLRLQQATALLDRPELDNQDIRLEKALVLQAQADWLVFKDNLQRAQQIFEQCLGLFEEMDAQWHVAESLMGLGSIAWRTGNYDLALEKIASAVAVQQALGDQIRRAEAMNRLGQAHRDLGHLDEAEQLHRAAMDFSQQLNDRPALVTSTVNLAHTLLWQGKFGMGEQLARESLTIHRELGYQEKAFWAHCVLCSNLLHSGQYQQAGQQTARALSLDIALDQSESLVPGWLCLISGHCALVESSYSQAQEAFAKSSEHFRQGWLYSVGFSLVGLGLTACRLDQLALARQYLSKALESVLASKTYRAIVYALPFVAYFLATTGRVERGLELWQRARMEPLVAHSKWFADVVGRELNDLATALPPGVAHAAGERGRSLDLWATAESLLAELGD